jgi:hypothetical protein
MRFTFAAAAVLLAGCAMKVSGFVSDAVNGHPIGGARVRIEDRIVYTTAVGTYILKVHKKPTATADVAAPGYTPSTVTCQTPGQAPSVRYRAHAVAEIVGCADRVMLGTRSRREFLTAVGRRDLPA